MGEDEPAAAPAGRCSVALRVADRWRWAAPGVIRPSRTLSAAPTTQLGHQRGQAVVGATTWVRRGALLLAALILVISAGRRLRPRVRSAVVLPSWFGPWTAAPLGVLVTGADLPNAFPYLVAVERLSAAEVPTGTGLAVLALYAAVYCLPCLLLLVAGLIWHRQINHRLNRVYTRLGGEKVLPRSVPAALGLMLLGVIVAVLAFTL